MFNKFLFILAHQVGEKRFYPTYKKIIRTQWKSYDELKKDQEKQLRHMINFAYQNVPYYHKVFNELKLSPDDINKIEDLRKLPILNKEIIKQNWEDFKPVNLSKISYYNNSTGGSTGTPLKYRLSKYDRFFNGALLYRGWGYGGYELGDKMVFLAGSSLDVGTKTSIFTKAHEITRNLKKLSSFDMDSNDTLKYVDIMNSFQPKFLRGYATSIDMLSKYIEVNDLEIHRPSAIFTASEKLHPHVRKNIENAFDCDVYDNYGLNDGGVSAFECEEHTGLHIDTERSIMEIIDESGLQIENGIGNIVATSLHNYAMPFIRYDTGDMGELVEDVCTCGRGSKLLNEIIGRSTDILLTPEGKSVHGWFFLYILWEYCTGIKEYQVVQHKINEIVIKIVKEEEFDEKQLDKIREIIREKSEGWNVKFEFVDKINRTKAGKYKFIINNVGEGENEQLYNGNTSKK